MGYSHFNLTLTLICYIPNSIPQFWTFKIISDGIYIVFDGHCWVFGSFISAWKNSLYQKILHTHCCLEVLSFVLFVILVAGHTEGISSTKDWFITLLHSTLTFLVIAAKTVRTKSELWNTDSHVICCICILIYINSVTCECDLSICCT